MGRTATAKSDVEDLLRVEHGLYNWLTETERNFGIPPEETRSSYKLDIIPFLRSGKTLCAIVKILFPECDGEPSTRTFLHYCRSYLKMDPDDLFTEADVVEITSLYDIIVSLMKIVDTIIDLGEDMDIKFPRKFNPPTDDRRNYVSAEDEVKYLRYVKIDVLDPTTADEDVSRVVGMEKSMSRSQSMVTNSFKANAFEGGADEKFVDDLAENFARENPDAIEKARAGVDPINLVEDFDTPLEKGGDIQVETAAPAIKGDVKREENLGDMDVADVLDNIEGINGSNEDIQNNVPKMDEEVQEQQHKRRSSDLIDGSENSDNKPVSAQQQSRPKIDVPVDHVPAVEKVKSAKAVKMFKETLSNDDFTLLEMRCREEIERIKAQLEKLYESSKTQYFDIWKQLLILSGKKHGLSKAQRFPEPMRNIKKVYESELKKNNELRRKCIELKAAYDASESKKAEIQEIIRHVDEQMNAKREGLSPSQARLERLKKENRDLKAERLNLDINITNQCNDLSRTRSLNSSFNATASKSYNASLSFAPSTTQKTPRTTQSSNTVGNIEKQMASIGRAQKRLEVVTMYYEEEKAKNDVLNQNIEKLNAQFKTQNTKIKANNEKITSLKRELNRLRTNTRSVKRETTTKNERIREIKSSRISTRSDPRFLNEFNKMNLESNKDIIDELDNDERVLTETIEAKNKQLQELNEKLGIETKPEETEAAPAPTTNTNDNDNTNDNAEKNAADTAASPSEPVESEQATSAQAPQSDEVVANDAQNTQENEENVAQEPNPDTENPPANTEEQNAAPVEEPPKEIKDDDIEDFLADISNNIGDDEAQS